MVVPFVAVDVESHLARGIDVETVQVQVAAEAVVAAAKIGFDEQTGVVDELDRGGIGDRVRFEAVVAADDIKKDRRIVDRRGPVESRAERKDVVLGSEIDTGIDHGTCGDVATKSEKAGVRP